jgi:hypothetical protein
VAAKNYNNAQVGGIEGRGREQGEQDGGWKGERERETIEGREGAGGEDGSEGGWVGE